MSQGVRPQKNQSFWELDQTAGFQILDLPLLILWTPTTQASFLFLKDFSFWSTSSSFRSWLQYHFLSRLLWPQLSKVSYFSFSKSHHPVCFIFFMAVTMGHKYLASLFMYFPVMVCSSPPGHPEYKPLKCREFNTSSSLYLAWFKWVLNKFCFE